MYILHVNTLLEPVMTYARIFQSGNSQAVRLPKEFRFNADQVEIFRQGNDIVLRQIPANAAAVFDLLSSLPDDFMADGREDLPPQEREAF
jgi:antitoxin VapB